MLHKVSDFVAKINSINEMAKELHRLKYETDTPKETIDHMIDAIKFDCLMVSKDNSEYVKK